MRNEKRVKVYQLRLDERKGPSDIVTELTHAVWRVFGSSAVIPSIDVHRWPDIYETFREIFAQRLTRYPECGATPRCRALLQSVYGRGPEWKDAPEPAAYFTLETRQTIEKFVNALSAMGYRFIRETAALANREKELFRVRLESAIHDALSDYVYYSGACRDCPVRHSLSEKRLW